jgi:hypothetical protein
VPKWRREVFAGASPSHPTACGPSRANPVIVSPLETAERPLNARLVYGGPGSTQHHRHPWADCCRRRVGALAPPMCGNLTQGWNLHREGTQRRSVRALVMSTLLLVVVAATSVRRQLGDTRGLHAVTPRPSRRPGSRPSSTRQSPRNARGATGGKARTEHGRGRYSLWAGDGGTALYLADCVDGGGEPPLP